MKSPLAFFRGFQLASGANLAAPSLQQVVLKRYFYKDRLVRLHETQVLLESLAGSKNVASTFKELMGHLFPEMDVSKDDFRARALKDMEGWKGKVFEISGRGVKMKDLASVAKDVAKLHNARRGVRRKRKRR